MVGNPFRMALLVIAILGGILSLALFIGGFSPDDTVELNIPELLFRQLVLRAPVVLLSMAFFWISVSSWFLWLYLSAKRWTPPAKQAD
jgi:hypothetical protein